MLISYALYSSLFTVRKKYQNQMINLLKKIFLVMECVITNPLHSLCAESGKKKY